MSRLSITLTGKALEIYKRIKSHERSKWVSEAIEEKDQREKGIIFTSEQQEIIDSLKEEINDIRDVMGEILQRLRNKE